MKIRRTIDSPGGGTAARAHSLSLRLPLLLLVGTVLCSTALAGCSRSDAGNGEGGTTSTSIGGVDAGDIEGAVGDEIVVDEAVVHVRALEVAFQPAMPTQRLSDATPTPPKAGEGFYQAYVRVENNGMIPIRIDPNDFLCAVGTSLAMIESTRSGPMPRSLIEGASLDLLLTFKAPTGLEAVLLYSPPWYDGVISISPKAEIPTTTTTES